MGGRLYRGKRSAPRVAAGIGLALASAHAVHAESDVCDGLARLAEGARTGALFEATSAPDAVAAMTGIYAAKPTACGRAIETAGAVIYCHWSYPFRNEAARADYDALASKLAVCLPAASTPVVDAEVNHPDSYAAATYELDHAAMSVSLKDKGGLGRTLIFLRVREK